MRPFDNPEPHRKRRRKNRKIILRRIAERKFSYRIYREQLARQRKALAKGNVPRKLVAPIVVNAPKVFSLFQEPNRKELTIFLRTIRNAALLHDKRVTIDFSKTEQMVACGTLLFLAECQRIMKLKGEGRRSPIDCRNYKNKKVAQVLQQIGFFSAIRKPTTIRPTEHDVVHWQAIHGVGADGEKAIDLVKEVKHRLPARLSSPMYNGLVEAMTNCIHHAYLQPRRDNFPYRGRGEWWMFATEFDGRLYVSICDLGIGIPRSLPLTQSESALLELLAKIGQKAGVTHSDATMIHAAIEMGRSRTRQEHRGKGFRDMIDVIGSSGSGRMYIYSNYGLVVHTLENGERRLQTRNYSNSILGTLIQWTVPVHAEVTHEHEQ